MEVICENCNGRGYNDWQNGDCTCAFCKGTGRIPKPTLMATYKSLLIYMPMRGGHTRLVFTDVEEALHWAKATFDPADVPGFCLVRVALKVLTFTGNGYFGLPLPAEQTEPEPGILLEGDRIVARCLSIAARWQHI